jgi:hypothetical protein
MFSLLSSFSFTSPIVSFIKQCFFADYYLAFKTLLRWKSINCWLAESNSYLALALISCSRSNFLTSSSMRKEGYISNASLSPSSGNKPAGLKLSADSLLTRSLFYSNLFFKPLSDSWDSERLCLRSLPTDPDFWSKSNSLTWTSFANI